MTIGEFTIVISYCGIMLNAMRYYFNLGKQYQETLVSYVRLKGILQIQMENNGEELPQSINRISIRNLSFSFGDNSIMQQFSVELHKGKVYALVGSNGSGKSTLVKILSGLYQNEMDGEIFINGTRIESVNMYQLRKSAFGISEQEPILVNDTIQFNLSFNNEKREYDFELLNELISILGLNDFLKQQPEGLNTVINERNDNISGGEKQKISILRALLKNPEVLILDEPTSALDQQSKNCFVEYIKSNRGNRITIIISHDPDIINSADCIIRLSDKSV